MRGQEREEKGEKMNDSMRDRALTINLVNAMGNGWTVGPRFPNAPSDEAVIAVKGDMRFSLEISKPTGKPERVYVYGLVPPPDPGPTYGFRSCGCDVSVALDRGVDAIAAEIERRLIPGYLPKLEAAMEAREAEVKRLAMVEAALVAMLKATGSRREPEHSQHPNAFTIGGNWHGCYVNYSGSVDLRLDNLPVAMALDIAAVFARAKVLREK